MGINILNNNLKTIPNIQLAGNYGINNYYR